MNSENMHPDLFTGHTMTFRNTVINALLEGKAQGLNDIEKGANIDAMRMCRLVNEKEKPSESEFKRVIEFLNEV